MKHLMILFSFIFLLASCGQKSASSPVSLKLFQGYAAVSIPSGGLYLVAENDLGKRFSKQIINTDEELILPNGVWKFMALSWDGPSVFEGTTRCDTLSAKLDGSDTSVSFNLSNSKCANAEFFGAAFGSTPYSFSHINCESSANVPSSNPTGTECQSSAGDALSYQLVLMNHNPLNGFGESSLLSCSNFSSSVSNTAHKIPNSTYFPFKVKLFKQANCGGVAHELTPYKGFSIYGNFFISAGASKVIFYSVLGNPLPVQSGLLNWFDANYSANLTMASLNVTAMTDRMDSTLILSSTAGSYPTRTTLSNGKQALVFGSTTYLSGTIPSPLQPNYTGLSHLSIVIAAKANNANDNVRMLFRKFDGSSQRDFELYQGASDFVTAGSTGSNFTYGGSQLFEVAGKKDIFTFIIANDPKTLELYDRNGSLINQNLSPASGVTNLGTILKIGDATGAFEGEIYEILVFNRQLSNAEMISVSNYLKNKWGI